MTTIKVLHLIDSAGLYGAEKVILTLLEELSGSHFPGILGCIRERESEMPEIASEAKNLGIPVVFFTMRRGYNPFGVSSVLSFIFDHDIKLVHSHGYKTNIFLGFSFNKSFKKISTVHGWSKGAGGLKANAYELIDAVSLRRLDSVIAVSQAVVEDLKKRGINEEKITLIYNGLKIDQKQKAYKIYEVRERYGVPENAFVIGTVGRLHSVKGHSYLLDAMPLILRRINDCKLLIAGEGPLKEALVKKIKKYNISGNVQLLGYVNDIDQFLAMIDLFVLPSLSEGLPISLLEAMAAGKPILASAVGGITEAITNRKEGVLIPPADPLSMANSITEIYQNKKMMSDMAMRSKLTVMNKFSSECMVRNYLSIYSSLFVLKNSLTEEEVDCHLF